MCCSPGRDHVEAGSALRTAAAFGWQTGRAAARSHRNPLRVVPGRSVDGFERVIVAGTRVAGPPLHRVDLTGALLVIPDEQTGGYDGGATEFARVDLPAAGHRYRLVASIVLAEAARQLGIRPVGRPARERFAYGSTITLTPPDADLVTPVELLGVLCWPADVLQGIGSPAATERSLTLRRCDVAAVLQRCNLQ